jgi:uncharacterized CHY-type Zn-finger protein
MKYDLGNIESICKSAKRTEDWAELFMAELVQYFSVVESHMTCVLCNNLMSTKEGESTVMVLPCQHSFCKSCHKGKKRSVDKCNICGGAEKEIVVNNWMNELAEKYIFYKAPLDKRMKWMKLRIEKNFIV